jgi:tetratricopeptide (TPR) repeat protein
MNKSFVGRIVGLSVLVAIWLSVGTTHTKLAAQDVRRDQADDLQSQILVGRVAVENGSAQVPDVTVVLECNGSERLRVNASLDGSFTVTRNAAPSSSSAISSRPGTLSLPPGDRSAASAFCVLYADAPGYTSEQLNISADRAEFMEVGTIVLHPLNPALKASATVSVASLAAPDKAKKAFEKGAQEEKKANWRSAGKYFRRAVEIYPQYGLAWRQLGRVQLQLHDLAEAQQSFQRAIAEDPHSAAGYLDLAEVAAQQKDWKLVAGTTDHLAQIAPDCSPKVWFFNSVARLNMGDVVKAEQSVKRGLRLDARREVPQLEYVYGVVLAREGRYVQAVEHVTTYLQLAPHAADLDAAKTTLSTVKALAARTPRDASR